MYYIDFDNTLFNTHKYGINLISKLYEKTIQCITKTKKTLHIDISEYQTIDYYFEKAKELSTTYNIPYMILEKTLKREMTDNEITNKSNYMKILTCLYEIVIQYLLSNNQEIDIDSFTSSKPSSTTANFFLIAEELASKYNISYKTLENELINTMLNDSKFMFPDAIKYLEDLKKSNEKICILTYVSNKNSISQNPFSTNNIAQQILKLAGSGISKLVDEVYITTLLKYNLGLDYQNNVFIDDSPRDLEGLYKRQHPETVQTPEAKQLFNDYQLTYVDFNNIYDTQQFNNTLITSLINKIAEESQITTNADEIRKYISTFDLQSPNFNIIIDCLSAKFQVKKQLLESVINSSYEKANSKISTDISQAQSEQDKHTIITSYNINNSLIKQQLLLVAYSGILPLAEGIIISNQPNNKQKRHNNNPTIYRINQPDNEKRTSKPVQIVINHRTQVNNENLIPGFDGFDNIPRNIRQKDSSEN